MRNRTGEMMSRCTNDLNQVRMVLGAGHHVQRDDDRDHACWRSSLMLALSPRLVWVLIPVPVVAFAVRYFGEVIHGLYEKIQASLATLSRQGAGKSGGRACDSRLRAGRRGEAGV